MQDKAFLQLHRFLKKNKKIHFLLIMIFTVNVDIKIITFMKTRMLYFRFVLNADFVAFSEFLEYIAFPPMHHCKKCHYDLTLHVCDVFLIAFDYFFCFEKFKLSSCSIQSVD